MLNYSLDSDEGDTCYTKLLLASPDEVLKQVTDHVAFLFYVVYHTDSKCSQSESTQFRSE